MSGQNDTDKRFTPEEEQDFFLDKGLKNIKAQTYHINGTIEKNNLRQCLKETNLLLNELRTSRLTAKNYYHLYIAAFDQMQYVENFMKEEIKRGRSIKYVYESVQQARYIIPRMYLLVTAGRIYIEVKHDMATEILFDLLQMIKGIQNPIRGLFARYYLLKMVKDRLPDKGNEYENEKSKLTDTYKFILQNLEEMNRLWMRLSMGYSGKEKQAKEKERTELRILVGENITRLSSLNGLDLETYKNEILPKIINILLESKDVLSQQYLYECIIQAFPDDYNIYCMETILGNMSNLSNGVDTISLYITLMEKLSRFVNSEGKNDPKIMEATQKIFSLLRSNIDSLIQKMSTQEDNNIMKFIDLCLAFMKFTVSSCAKEEKLGCVNHILETVNTILEGITDKIDQDGIKLIERLLSSPLDSELSLFEFNYFSNIMSHLDFISRSNLSLRIIESFVNGTSTQKLSDVEKIKKLLSYVNPLLEDLSDSVEPDEFQFNFEQNMVCKLIFVIESKDPNVILDIFNEFKTVFLNGGDKRRKVTLPSLANAIIGFCYQVSLIYDNKQGKDTQKNKTNIYNSILDKFDISSISNDEAFYNFMLGTYKSLNEVISNIATDNLLKGLKFYLDSAIQVNNIQSNRTQFEEACASFVNAAMSIYNEGKYDQDLKYPMLSEIIGSLLNMKILSKDFLMQLISNLQQSAQAMVKRNDQCNAMLGVSSLYYTLLNAKDKVVECVNKAKRFADFSMTNPHNLNLFIIIMNKILYFEEADSEEFIPIELIEDIIEIVKNHIQTIKTENGDNADYLAPIEMYFNSTLDVIRNRKATSNKKLYQSLNY